MSRQMWVWVGLAGCGSTPEPAEPAEVVAAPVVAAAEIDAPVVPAPDGRELFARVWVSNDPRTPNGDGLGPQFNAESCATCHHLGGLGGAGGLEVNVGVAGTARTSLGTRARLARPGALGGSFAERATPALFGAGVIDAIPDEVLVAAAASSDVPEVSGRVGRDAEGRVTRFGWKGNVATLASFVERACAGELGLQTPNVPQPGVAGPGPDLDQASVDALVGFVASLPRPQLLDTPGVDRGRAVFADVGCAACHRERLGAVDGLYSDLLLHDLGPDLGDAASGYYGVPAVVAGVEDGEWRTPPLWGVRDSAPYLHDGRAETLAEAIHAHGGEARPSVEAWRSRSEEDRALLVRFLQSLSAPTG